jgi:hypothetical protein
MGVDVKNEERARRSGDIYEGHASDPTATKGQDRVAIPGAWAGAV